MPLMKMMTMPGQQLLCIPRIVTCYCARFLGTLLESLRHYHSSLLSRIIWILFHPQTVVQAAFLGLVLFSFLTIVCACIAFLLKMPTGELLEKPSTRTLFHRHHQRSSSVPNHRTPTAPTLRVLLPSEVLWCLE